MELKAVPAEIKAGGDGLADGQFEAVVSVFGNVDSYGDVVMPGAFADSLAERADSGKFFPIVFSHGSNDAENFIGKVVDAAETDEGLQVRGELFIDTDRGGHVHRLMKEGLLDQFSFAYRVKDSRPVQVDGVQANGLYSLDLFEVGPTLIGANEATHLIGVKSRPNEPVEVKVGRAISAKNESRLRDAHASIGEVLDSLGDAAESGKAREQDSEDEELSEAKSEDEEPDEVKSSAAPDSTVEHEAALVLMKSLI